MPPRQRSKVTPFAEDLRQDVLHAGQDVGGCGEFFLGIDQLSTTSIQVCRSRIGVQDFQRQRLQASLARHGSQGLLLGTIGQIEIFEDLERSGCVDSLFQIGGENTLGLDRTQNAFATIMQLPFLLDRLLDLPNPFFVQATGLVPAIACNEGNRVAFVEQFHRGPTLARFQLQLARNRFQIRCRESRGVHRSNYN